MVEGFHASIHHVRAQNSAFTILTSTLEVFEKRFLIRRQDTLISERLVIFLELLEHARSLFLETGKAYAAIAPIDRAAAVLEATALQNSTRQCESLYTLCQKTGGLNVVLPFLWHCCHIQFTGECRAKGSSGGQGGSKGCPGPVLSAACFDPRYPEFHALLYIKHLTPKIAAKLNHPDRRARISGMLCHPTSTTGIFRVPSQPCSPPHSMSGC